MAKQPNSLILLFAFLLLMQTGYAKNRADLGDTRERIALFPLEQKGLSPEEVSTLTGKFIELLQRSGRFEVMSQEETLALLTEANFDNIETCNYSFCLADAGKVLGVPKLLHGSIMRRGKSYSLRFRLIDVSRAEVVFDKKAEHSGEFDSLVTNMLPVEAKAVSEYALKPDTKWYVIAAAVVVTVGAIYWVYKAFDRTSAGEGSGDGPPTEQ